MRIQSLSLEQFRSYERLGVEFDAGIALLLGENGTGKTNLIEALTYLSVGRSCLRVDPEHAVRWGTDFFRVRCGLKNDNGEDQTLEYVWQRLPRRASAAFVRDVRTPLLSFIGVLPTVTFLPQDLDLFVGSPGARRSFLDLLLSQLHPPYAGKRMEYERVVKQRNSLLKRIGEGMGSVADLAPWDHELSVIGADIQERRLGLVAIMHARLPQTVSALGETEWAELTCVYQRSNIGSSIKEIAADLKKQLTLNQDRDLVLRSTTIGPHRDDWNVQLEGKDIAHFASRGQQRATLIGLLLLSTEVLRAVRGERPVILLDDVFSELDDHHQASLLKALDGHQVLITATHPPREPLGTVFEVGEGRVERRK